MKSLLLVAVAALVPLVALADDAAKTGVATVAAKATDAKSKNMLKPANDPESWRLELAEGGKGDMKANGDAIVFNVAEIDGTDWHVQAYQTKLDLKNGKDYVVKFKAKAPKATLLLVVCGIDQEDWHEVGLHEELGPSEDFKQYEFTFTASDVAEDNNRLGFVMGNDKGTVSIKDLSLTEK
jgi:hypothetical protein